MNEWMNEWRSWCIIRDNPLSYFLVLVITRAAALRTRWSLSVTERGDHRPWQIKYHSYSITWPNNCSYSVMDHAWKNNYCSYSVTVVILSRYTGQFLADRTNGRAYATVLRLSVVCRLSSVTLCIVAKRCVLEQKLLLRAYRKSYMRNRLVSKWMTLTFIYRSYQGHVNRCVTFDVEYLGNR